MTAAAHRPDRQADRARRRHADARRARRRRRRGGGRGRADGAPGRPASLALVRDPFPLDEAIGAETTAATDAARFVIELRAELDPALYRGLLRARRPVLVRGVGRRFSGVYYVQSVRTTLESATLLQSFVATRNAHRADGPGELRPVRRGGAGDSERRLRRARRRLVGRPLLRQVRGRRHRRRRPEEDRPHPRARCRPCSARRSTAAGRCRACRPAAARSAGCCSCRRSATRCGSSSPPATSAGRSGSGRSGARPTAPAAPTTSAPRPAPRRRRATARTPRRRSAC